MNVKKIFALFLIAAGVLLAGSCAAVLAFSNLNKPVTENGNSLSAGSSGGVLFTVESGSSVKEITADLENTRLIRSGLFAHFYSRFFNLSLKAGTYMLSPSASTAEILRTISEGDIAVFKITVPEGLTLSKTAGLFSEAGIRAEDFIRAAKDRTLLSEFNIPASSAEGYLFPDTYFVSYGTSSERAVRMMVSTFFEKAAALEGFPGRGEDLHDKVILASIVEREYRVKEEAPLIAGVFVNRLKINMGLQSCATIEYIITEIMGREHPERLTAQDIAVENDYNTYLWAGLPPGPISNPGLTALQAAFSPAKTKYFYFRLNDNSSGTHTFTVSLDDHIEAGREIYLKQAAGGK